MTNFVRLGLLTVLSVASANYAAADTIHLASYGSTNSAPTGAVNTGVLASGAPTYDIGTGGVWASPIGNSSWVSNNPQNFPGGSNIAPNGSYIYTTTFWDNSAATSTGILTLLADDTASVYLNGVLLIAAAPAVPAPHCTQGGPNCMTPTSTNMSGFVNGTNTLTFNVQQDFGGAQGVDFAGVVNTSPVPEPSSFFLLGTGLLGAAGAAYRRIRS